MNKTQLVDALAARIGDRRTAASAVDGLLQTIMDTVGTGGSVSITGFGVFESRARAARVARNPRTGETVDVPATTVPAFRPGASFRSTVGGGAAPARRAAPVRRPRAVPVPVADVPAAVGAAAPDATSTTDAAPSKPARRSARAKSDTAFVAAKAAPAKAVPEKAAKSRVAKAKPAEDKAKKAKAKK